METSCITLSDELMNCVNTCTTQTQNLQMKSFNEIYTEVGGKFSSWFSSLTWKIQTQHSSRAKIILA